MATERVNRAHQTPPLLKKGVAVAAAVVAVVATRVKAARRVPTVAQKDAPKNARKAAQTRDQTAVVSPAETSEAPVALTRATPESVHPAKRH